MSSTDRQLRMLRRMVIVSLLDEKTRSQATDEAWTGELIISSLECIDASKSIVHQLQQSCLSWHSASEMPSVGSYVCKATCLRVTRSHRRSWWIWFCRLTQRIWVTMVTFSIVKHLNGSVKFHLRKWVTYLYWASNPLQLCSSQSSGLQFCDWIYD